MPQSYKEAWNFLATAGGGEIGAGSGIYASHLNADELATARAEAAARRAKIVAAN